MSGWARDDADDVCISEVALGELPMNVTSAYRSCPSQKRSVVASAVPFAMWVESASVLRVLLRMIFQVSTGTRVAILHSRGGKGAQTTCTSRLALALVW